MGKLTAAQQAFAEFLRVDQDLIAAAASVSVMPPDASKELNIVLGTMRKEDMIEFLLRVAHGEGGMVTTELLRLCRARENPAGSALSCHELRHLAETERARRKAKEAEAKEKKRQEQEKQRHTHLQKIFSNSSIEWKIVEDAALLGTSSAYEKASSLIHDLAEAYTLHKQETIFHDHLARFAKQHAKRKALLRRLRGLLNSTTQ